MIAAAAALSMLGVMSPVLAGGAAAGSRAAVDVIVVLDGAHAPGGHAANQQRAAEVARSHGLQPSHTYGSALFGFAASVPEGRLASLERDPRVISVHEDGVMRALEHPTGVKRIDADDVQATVGGATGTGIRVAILDTGIIAAHPDLPNIGAGHSCIPGTTTHDDHGHGTHVAGTVGASVASSVTGVAPAVTLLPVKVLDASGNGEWSEIICGIDWVTSQKAAGSQVHVANLSLGAAGSYSGEVCDDAGDPVFDALCRAIGSGTTFTVAAGNDGVDASGFVPAAHPQVITVSAFSDTDGVANGTTSCSGRGLWKTCDESFASFSNHGPAIDVMAPGVNITSTTNDGGTGTKSGTSMAAPHVAGVVALLLEASPGMLPDAVEAHLKANGQCPDTAAVPAAGVCAGTWHNDPDGITEPLANAAFAIAGLGSGGGSDDGTANRAPDALDDAGTTDPTSGAVTIAVLQNDSDPDGDGLTVTEATAPSSGTATINSDGTITYQHGGSASTSDSFTYTVSDGRGGSDTAIVTITISSATEPTDVVWVSDLDGSASSHGNTWTPRVTIHVSTAASGVRVIGTWGAGSVDCTTGPDGSCWIDGPTVKKNVSSATFTVTDVVASGMRYDATANDDPDGDSTGTKITIAKP